MRHKECLVVCFMMLSGCERGASQQIANSEPILELRDRVQIGVNEEFNYRDYIQEASDKEDGTLIEKVTVKDIDTKQVGSQSVEFTLTDSSHQTVVKKMKVDIVHFFDNGVYSPLEVEPDIIENPSDVTTLVNKVNQIPEGYKPTDLEPVIDNKNQQLRKEANRAYTKFYNAAKQKGIELYSISGYRTNDKQTLYWNNQVKVFGEQYASLYSAYPGRSEHQLGLAIDVSYKTTGDRLSESVASSEIGQFIVSDAYQYGFILRYPKDKVSITNYAYEPWHIRYVGVELATKLHLENITLEEYNQ